MAGQTETWPGAEFTEKAFYLAEFRGRTLAIACGAEALESPAALRSVLGELEHNRTRVVLLVSDPGLAAELAAPPLAPGTPLAPGPVWRTLRSAPRVAVALPAGDAFPAACRQAAVGLRVPKLVFLDGDGALLEADGSRASFVDLAELGARLEAPDAATARRAPLLREVEAALRGGVAAVNVCTARGLAEELFSYAGSGTLFTRERYVDVRRLALDDLAAANDLVARGVAEGYLAERSGEDLDAVFAHGFGAFVEGRHLAGIAALLPRRESGSGEIASLYTLTRFLGEGIGGHLVAALCREAREAGQAFVFACTTAERVAGFFERQGFRRVAPEAIPTEKWSAYDRERRDRVLCLRRDLE